MRLWNEYEGTTIADAYPLEKLIRPEGRSAFFTTSNGTGTPAVIRLIESIHDEDEILSRWKTVSELGEEHLVTLKKFGHTVYDGTPLIYVLMEKTEADLASILAERPLTEEETRQVAESLIDAVKALHRKGIVHEHIEAANVLAAGEMVKLRSDCVREASEGEEGAAAMRRDVQDVATVLLQALTQRKSLEAIGGTRLPVPFDAMIRNGLAGRWGLEQMAGALNPPKPEAVAKAPVKPQESAVAAPVMVKAEEAKVSATPSAKPVAAAETKQPRAEQMPLVIPETKEEAASEGQWRSRRGAADEEEGTSARRRWWIAAAPAAVVILAALGWHAAHKPSDTAMQPVTTLSDAGKTASNAAQGGPSTAAPAPAATQPVAPVALPADAGEPRWRVVSYTYNRQDQAEHKVREIAEKHADLRPGVFSPNGRAPYLVTLGGAMSRDQAAALRQKAIGEGQPKDTYIQNYGGRETPRRHRRR